jgi:hypothetical protein
VPNPLTFTVVVTVFERTDLIPHVLFGVSRQEWPHWDLLLVADGPHPAAGSIVDQFRLSVPAMADRIKYLAIPHAPGAWGNVARFKGLEMATGHYTVILGHDCLVFPGYLAAHAENIVRMPGCLSLVDVDMWITRAYGKPQVWLPHPEYRGVWPTPGCPVDDLKIAEVDLTCMAFPTERARQLGIFNRKSTQYCADYTDAYRVCARAMPVAHRPGVVAGHF